MGRNPALRRRGESENRSTYLRRSLWVLLTFGLARMKVKRIVPPTPAFR